MIVFKGELSENVKKEMSRNFRKILLVLCLSFALITGVVILVLTLKLNHMFAFCFVFPALFLILPFLPFKLEAGSEFLIEKIEISDEDIAVHTKESFNWYGVEHVKKIVNKSDCYIIYVRQGLAKMEIVCQKDLITEGTLEEFEEKFADFLIDEVD